MPNRYAPPPPHGTQAMYQRHMRKDKKPCKACRDAHNVAQQYMRARTLTKKAKVNKDKKAAQARAYRRAVRRLIDLYPIEYEALMIQEEKEEPLLCGDDQLTQETQELQPTDTTTPEP